MITTKKQLAKKVPEVCSTFIVSTEKDYKLIVYGDGGKKEFEVKKDLVRQLVVDGVAYHANILTIDKVKLKQ